MDSPESATTAPHITDASSTTVTDPTSSSGSPPVQDSPIFSYLSNLSPIKHVKASHSAHQILEISSPPLVFTSPRVNPLREDSCLRRPPLPRPLTAEIQKAATTSVLPGRSVTQSNGKGIEVSLDFSEKAEHETQVDSESDAKPINTEEKQNSAETHPAKVPDDGSNLIASYTSIQTICEHSVVHTNNDSRVSDGTLSKRSVGVGGTLSHDLEASQNQRGELRRCLQFGDALNPVANKRTYQDIKRTTNMSCSAARTMDLKDVGSPQADTATSHKQLSELDQPVILSSDNSEKLTCRDSRPRTVLHLNSLVKSFPMGVSAIAKLTEKNTLSVHKIKSGSDLDFPIVEKIKGDTMSSASMEDGSLGTNHSDVRSAASFSLHSLKPLSYPLKQIEQLQSTHEKRKHRTENVDSFEDLNQMSPKKKKISSSPNDGAGCRRCSCRKTKCLKLYCDCFAAGIYCAEPCACQGCFNRPEYEDTVLETRQQIESRNPLAFAPKIQNLAITGYQESRILSTPSSARHKRGCNCKKSMCLKKYCECYQANVGCSDGCRCVGCQNINGRKEDYGSKQFGSESSDEMMVGTFDENMGIVASQTNFINTESCNSQSFTPLTPMFQYSNQGEESEFLSSSQRFLSSPESNVNALSSYEKSSASRNWGTNDMLQDSREKILELGCHEEPNFGNLEGIEQITPRSGLANLCHLAPMPVASLKTPASTASTRARPCTDTPQSQLHTVSACPPSSGSLRWRSSPVTPASTSGPANFMQRPESDSLLCRIPEDDTPDVLKDTNTPKSAVKVSSPNKKRVSPPQSHLHEPGSSSSVGLRSGRRFILQAVPSLPPLTPCVEFKGIGHKKNSDCQGDYSK